MASSVLSSDDDSLVHESDKSNPDYTSRSPTLITPTLSLKTEHLGDGSSEVDDDKPNDFPILHDYDLKHLLSSLSIYQLAKCRLVCKLWNQISLKIIPQKAHYLSIEKWEWDKQEALPKQDNVSLEDIPKLIELIRNSERFPWTKFKISGQLSVDQDDKDVLHNLFTEIGPIATEIWVSNLRSSLFSKDTIAYPALKALDLHYRYRSPGEGWERTADFALNIVNKAPKLTTLCLNGYQMMEQFMQILETENGRRVTKLMISSLIENEHLDRLSTLGLQLVHLSLKFDGAPLRHPTTEINSSKIFSFLGSQRSTLEKLQIGEAEENPDLTMTVRFPQMEKLKVLKIALPCLFPDVDYLQQFPVLKKLEFWLYDPEMTTFASFFNSGIKPVDTVEELIFSSDMKDAEIILHAGRQFPKLKKIALHANSAFLDCVERSMPNLVEMRILCEGDEDLDAILTGLSTAECEKMKHLNDCSLDNLGPIPCLKGLRKLELVKDPWFQFLLSDFGCLHALLKMERLHTLEFVGGYNSQIGDETSAILKNKVVVLM